MKRSELKALIKECLVEILNEGLQGRLQDSIPNNINTSAYVGPNKPQQPVRKQVTEGVRKKPSDYMVVNGPQQTPKLNYNEFQQQAQRHLPDVPVNMQPDIMQSIMADAQQTMRLQDGVGGRHTDQAAMQGDRADRIAAQIDPLDFFQGSTDVWGALAFGETKK